MAKRLLVSAFFVSLTLVTIFILSRWVLLFVIEVFALLGFYEFLNLVQKKGIEIYRPLALVLAFFIPFAVVWSVEYVYFACLCLAIFIFHFRRDVQNQAMVSTAVTIFGMVYIVWFLSYIVKLRFELGPAWVFYTVLLTKGGDAGAYFVGIRYGKVKLFEAVSPNKSWEGAWGGLATTMIASLASRIYLTEVSWTHLIILGLGIGVVSQLGDLVESLMKRNVGAKDSGSIPGLGGILDILDSVLFPSPLVYFYATVVLGLR